MCRVSWFDIDNKLSFNLHISKICKSPANQLNALIRLKQFLSFHAKEVLINSYIISNCNYCPLVWMFLSAQSVNKTENLQKRALRFLYDFCEASYEDLLSEGAQKTFAGLEDVLKTSSTRLHLNNFCLPRCLEEVLQRHLEDVLEDEKLFCWRRLQHFSRPCLEDVLKTCLDNFLKTCFEDVLKTCLEEIFNMSSRQKIGGVSN